MESPKEVCFNCKFFYGPDWTKCYGQCRKKSKGPKGWPEVSIDDWCGEHKAATKPDEPHS